MIKCTIELIPYGWESEKKVIGTIDIINDGTGTHQFGNYFVHITRDRNHPKITFKVENFRRARGIYHLLHEIFNEYIFQDLDNATIQEEIGPNS